VKRSRQRRFARLRSEARGGDVEAQLELASRLDYGDGLRKSKREARRWYERAAAQGSAHAMVNLGKMLALGEGGPVSRKRANALYRRSADLGNAVAMYNLGGIYRHGRGVRKDLRRAFAWVVKAAELGDLDAIFQCEILAEKLGFALAPRRLTRWLRTAAGTADPDAMLSYGVHLFEGRGVRRDRKAALLWYRRAARQGDMHAHYNLGQMYRRGHAVRQSWPRALACYRKAARAGHPMSCLQLAWYYEEERKNPRLHLCWLREAARRGVAQAQCDLGVHYINGDGVREDEARGAKLYAAAAAQGHSWATYLLGLCHRDGLGVRRDARRARRLFELAIRAASKEDPKDGRETRTHAWAALRALASPPALRP